MHFDWLAWSNPVAVWWGFLLAVSSANIALWLALHRHFRIRQWRAVQAELMVLLCAAYVFGCAFRSILPRADVQRICLFDTWLSSVLVGRSVATVEAQLRGMYDRARTAGIPVVAASIIPYNSASAEQNDKMHAINAWIAAEAARGPNMRFVDTRKAAAAAGNLDRLAGSPDGLHPDVPGYHRMADAIEPVLKSIVEKR